MKPKIDIDKYLFAVDDSLDIKIGMAASLANQYIMFHAYDDLLNADDFTHTTLTPEQVANQFGSWVTNAPNRSVKIKAWKPWNPWTAAIATTFKNKPNEIYINVRKIASRSLGDYVNTLCHEASHLSGMGHGNNSPRGKERSAPYFLGSKAEAWYESN